MDAGDVAMHVRCSGDGGGGGERTGWLSHRQPTGHQEHREKTVVTLTHSRVALLKVYLIPTRQGHYNEPVWLYTKHMCPTVIAA